MFKNPTRWALALCTLALLAAGGVVRADDAPSKGEPKKEPDKKPGVTARKAVDTYRLKPGDEIAVSVQPQEKYDTAGAVLPDGKIYLKNVGEIKAAGMTVKELQAQVYKVLNVTLLNPDVVVSVTRVADEDKDPIPTVKVTVVGAVVKPGPLELDQGFRVRQAIDNAGGTVKEAMLSSVVIYHKDLTQTIVDLSNEKQVGNPIHNRVLEDGDQIEVRYTPVVPIAHVRIDGAVTNPNVYELKDGSAWTLNELIVNAGKMLPLADVKHVEFVRKGERTKILDLVELQKKGGISKIALQDGDAVFIPQQENTVMLVGAVPTPGPLPLRTDSTVKSFFTQADLNIIAALDPTRADISDVLLIRGEEHGMKINLKDALAKGASSKSNVALKPGDIIFIPDKKAPNDGVGKALRVVPYLGVLTTLFSAF